MIVHVAPELKPAISEESGAFFIKHEGPKLFSKPVLAAFSGALVAGVAFGVKEFVKHQEGKQ